MVAGWALLRIERRRHREVNCRGRRGGGTTSSFCASVRGRRQATTPQGGRSDGNIDNAGEDDDGDDVGAKEDKSKCGGGV